MSVLHLCVGGLLGFMAGAVVYPFIPPLFYYQDVVLLSISVLAGALITAVMMARSTKDRS